MTGASWAAGTTRAAIYCALSLAAPRHMQAGEVAALLNPRKPAAVHAMLDQLHRDGFIAHPLKDTGKGSWCIDETCARTPGVLLEVLQDLRIEALREIDLCPGGMSLQLLCIEFQCELPVMLLALRQLLRDGRLVQIEMPVSHGGGSGYKTPRNVEQQLTDAHRTGTDPADEGAPAITRLATRYSSAGQHGAYAITLDGQLLVRSSAASFVLPEPQTRELFQWLDSIARNNGATDEARCTALATEGANA